MADNIRIVGNINNTSRVTRISNEDLNLLSPEVRDQYFGFENDYIELFVYDTSNNLISFDYNYKSFKLPSDVGATLDNKLPIIEIDPIQDLQNLNYVSGEFITQYNFQKSYISNSELAELFISEISSDRTEIRLNSTSISSDDLQTLAEKLIQDIESESDTKYYIFNLSDNRQFLIINAAVDTESQTLLLKLYEPLSINIQDKENGWITEEIIEPYVFNINLDASVLPPPVPQLRGPNFDIDVDIKQNIGTKYENYNSLVSSLTGSSYHKVLNYMNDNSYDLNIDYTSFENFVHFSSAKKRLEIFYSKVKQIENYNNDINIIVGSTNVLKNEQTSSIKLKINDIITNFDGFESYMYFESSSYTWPKTSTVRPYTLSTTSSANTWYSAYTSSAINYDEENLDRLYNVIPTYIKNDPTNYQPYYDFIDMIGHYFDNIWIYITSINELYNADNNLEKGVSKDIVYDALKSLGVKLYNSKGDDEFDNYIGGINSGSTLFVDDFSVTSSYLNNIPKKDQLAELYKRIYHNIPLLSKTKGTSAGLQNLITTFGITSSIFQPKEFGGSTKTNELKGYDNDKITIQNNTITGSVLSPFISLQNPLTSSNEFTSTDLHFVDLSFSPQNQLNFRLSASVAVAHPTFSLDEYIGDPRLMESSSYDSLNTFRDTFISASSAVSGSAQKLDYKGFIELVKYFDNSLFKMLKDFVPARANTLTGITIKSPVLERNKIKSYKPKVTEEIVYDAEYNAPIISEDNDYYYNKIEGNKSSFYTGEFTGSYANVNDIFENSNPNVYLHPTESVNINQFEHTDFNITLNNISSSVTSVSRQKLERLYSISNQQVLSSVNEYSSSAELQESNLSLKGFQNSRYDGTRLSSLTYNNYSSASSTYNGDISYGKTAVIDHNTRKLGLFTQIQKNELFEFPQRNNVTIKYLVDENGNLTELNRKNKRWHEIQNTFKIGDTLTVTQFAPQKYSDQRATDGIKNIYNSGYSYFPILYSGVENSDDRLYFNFSGQTLSKKFRIELEGGFISGSSTNLYPINSGNIFSAFNKNVDEANILYSDGNEFYLDNGPNTFSTYSIQDTGTQTFNAKFIVKLQFQSNNQTGNFRFNINKIPSVGASTTLASQSVSYASGNTSVRRTDWGFAKKLDTTIVLDTAVRVYDGSNNYVETLPINTTLRAVQAAPGVTSDCRFFTSATLYVIDNYYTTINTLKDGCTDVWILPSLNRRLYTLPQPSLSSFLYFDVTTPEQSFTLTDKIGFEFKAENFSTNNFTASLERYSSETGFGYLSNEIISNQIGSNPYAVNTVTPYISGSTNIGTIRNNTLVLSQELSYFLDYQYLPSGSNFANSLYKRYGDVDYTFSPKSGDVILLYYGSNNYLEGNIASAFKSKVDNKVYITLSTELPSALTTPTYTNSTINKFVILSQKPDENNLILSFDQKPGATSLGFIIPSNIHPDILANIDTITKEVNQKLIDIGSSDIGGTF